VGSSTIAAIAASGMERYTGNNNRGELIGGALVSLFFDGFGLFMAYRYSATGLRVVCNYLWFFFAKDNSYKNV
jgi:hypothetical protein